MSRKPRFATVWLGGCSGCHMSFLDIDEWVIELADLVDIVYTPIADIKEYPEDVDIVLVEGAIANEDNLEMIHKVRANTKMIIAFGDCAVTVMSQRCAIPSVQPIRSLRQYTVTGLTFRVRSRVDRRSFPY